ncbi:hypothetical protein [Streptomyces sp. MAR4 CNX-425]|uniref:hypothetical protein n=1 Tax=Streptomyces sp. MAR4 CNX-425 TaxID=3406343 RepID=UPI003B5066F2
MTSTSANRHDAPTQTAPPLLWGRNSLPVPYAAAWSGEVPAVGAALTIREDGSGLAYRDERALDRDRHGVLWARLTEAPGVGRPVFRSLHSHRQRRAMLGMLCQVCGAPAGRTARGWLFLLQQPGPGEQPAHWPEGALSAKPPVCAPCARLALRYCPHLTVPLALRVRKPRVWGVFGGLVTPGVGGALVSSPNDECLPYGHPAARWFLASQLVLELRHCRAA